MSVRKFFTRKKIIWSIIIILVIALVWYFVAKGKNQAGNIQTAAASVQNLKQTVLTTGQVVSATDLSLSFQGSGVVKEVLVKAGDKVKSGDTLATLNQANAQAALVSAQGAFAQANANYQRVLAGATAEQIKVSQEAVNAARVAYNNAVTQLTTVQQTTAATLSQAQKTLTDLQSPTTLADNKRSAILTTISTQLASVKSAVDQEQQILDDDNLEPTFGVTDLAALTNFKSAFSQVKPLLDAANASLALAQGYKSDVNIDQAVSDAINALNQNISALNYCFVALSNSIPSSTITQAQLDAYKTAISTALASENPGVASIRAARQALTDALTAASNAVINAGLAQTQQIAAAQNQINSAQAALQQVEANLNQQQAKAKPADINIAKAQILSAQGQVEAAQAALANLIIKAPAEGTITQVDIKVGEQASAMQPVMVLQDISSLHAEAYVSEANVASLKIGQPVDYTFDALGPDRHFNGQILTINPASTVISGVVNYLVKADLPSIPEIKPGMTVNMTVLVASKDNVLAVPNSAVINNSGRYFIRIINDPKKNTFYQAEVQTGLSADGGLVEIIGGLEAGQTIVTYIKP
jgi:HlyD family secretion protein